MKANSSVIPAAASRGSLAPTIQILESDNQKVTELNPLTPVLNPCCRLFGMKRSIPSKWQINWEEGGVPGGLHPPLRNFIFQGEGRRGGGGNHFFMERGVQTTWPPTSPQICPCPMCHVVSQKATPLMQKAEPWGCVVTTQAIWRNLSARLPTLPS